MTSISASGVVVRRTTDHVAEVVLDRPEALNALSTALCEHLTGVLLEIALDSAVRVVVLSSSNDRAFCVGADLKERAGFGDEQLLAQRPVIRAVFGSLLALPMPAIAAVSGFALGGGLELALSCDLIVAEASAVFGLTEVTVGLIPGGGGTQLLARRIGAGRAADLILTGRKVESHEAFRLGIVDRIAAGWPVRELALEIAGTIAENSPVAVRHAKHALRAGFGMPLSEGLEIEDAAWRAAAMSADRISLRDVGPRDGLQNEAPVSTRAKIELVDALSQTGLRRIEAVSFVQARAIPQMADAEDVWADIEHLSSITYSALVPNLRGAIRALAAGCLDIEIVVSASDTHNRANVNRSTAESLDDIARVISLAHEQGAVCHVTVATAWGCPYEGDIAVDRVVGVAKRAVADGADGLSFGDTTGMATPIRVTELVGETRMALAAVPLNLHFHNTRGTALANVLAALELGVADFDASVGGLGGCPYAPGASGNLASEELVHMVEDMGVATGVDLEALIDVAAMAERIVGRELPSQVLRAGPRTRLTRYEPH